MRPRHAKLLRFTKWIASSFGATIALSLYFSFAPNQVTPVAPRMNERLRVITYNTQLLPLEILNKRANSPYRAKQQAAILAQYDIIGLNEVFRASRRRDLLDSLRDSWGEDFQVVTPNPTDQSLLGLDSGLILLSRFPILESHTLTFGNDSKIRERGFIADAYAKKGAIHARLAYTSPEKSIVQIDCFVTHLESQDSAIRDEQILMLAGFIKKHASPVNPVLLLGDFNTIGDHAGMASDDSQYRTIWRALSAMRKPWVDVGESIDPTCWGTADAADPTGGNRIDYIFLANPAQGLKLAPRKSAIQRFVDPHVGFLSDHAAVEAEFAIE